MLSAMLLATLSATLSAMHAVRDREIAPLGFRNVGLQSVSSGIIRKVPGMHHHGYDPLPPTYTHLLSHDTVAVSQGNDCMC